MTNFNFTEQSEANAFTIGMLLLDGFNAMAMQAFIDPFRSANYLRNTNLYRWHFIGLNNGMVRASSGMEVTVSEIPKPFELPFDMLVINSSWNTERFNESKLLHWLYRCQQSGSTVCGLDTGAFIMAYAGLLSEKRAAVHYEHIAAFRELFPDVTMDEDIFVIDGNTLSCCGGLAASDLALEIIRMQQGLELANGAARYIFHDRLRSGQEGQLPDRSEPVGYSAPAKLREAIIIMEGNLENLLPINRIAMQVNISQRQLVRLFHKHTGVTPVRYYLDVRLDRARGLITQTELPILDVAIACGFSGNAQFTRAYKSRFGETPSRDRIKGRVPFQFRSFPSFAGV